LRLLSDDSADDTSLYKQACRFVANIQDIPDNAQTASLRIFAQQFDDLQKYVKHQERRFGDGHHYGPFYKDLHRKLDELKGQAGPFVPNGLTDKVRKGQVEFYAGLLAREFVQHMVVEAQLQRRMRRVGR